jgi:hypothetical protein
MRLFHLLRSASTHEYIEIVVFRNSWLGFNDLWGTLAYLFLLFHLLGKFFLNLFHLSGGVLRAGCNAERHHIIVMLSSSLRIDIIIQSSTILLWDSEGGNRFWCTFKVRKFLSHPVEFCWVQKFIVKF